jgi:hypothetical protein
MFCLFCSEFLTVSRLTNDWRLCIYLYLYSRNRVSQSRHQTELMWRR